MKYFLSAALTILAVLSFAQQGQSALEKVEAAKIALITERLQLTPEQAEKFWPIYREFSDKQQTLRQEFRNIKANHNPETATDDENKRMLQKGMELKEKQLALEKTYTERMQNVISTRQMMNLRKAEDDFRQMLIDRVRDQQMKKDQIQQNRIQNNQNLQRKRNN